LWWALGLNAGFMVAELIGAFVSGSLALAADSVHMASDVAALGVALLALRLTRRSPTARYTYGWHRAEILGAQFNAAILLGAAGLILVEAVRRIGQPAEIHGTTVIVIATIGLAVNVIAAVILSRHAGDNLNMRAALWHMATDALGSVAALAAGIAAAVAGVTSVDLVSSAFIALLVAAAAWQLLRDSTAIILEAAPASIDQVDLVAALTACPGVDSVHHLHVWSLDSETAALSAHLLLADEPSLHDAQLLGEQIKQVLAERYGIDHATLEYECHDCSYPPPEVMS
jgi:cobalt-zinc-cadmium efflux system protein